MTKEIDFGDDSYVAYSTPFILLVGFHSGGVVSGGVTRGSFLLLFQLLVVPARGLIMLERERVHVSQCVFGGEIYMRRVFRGGGGGGGHAHFTTPT